MSYPWYFEILNEQKGQKQKQKCTEKRSKTIELSIKDTENDMCEKCANSTNVRVIAQFYCKYIV